MQFYRGSVFQEKVQQVQCPEPGAHLACPWGSRNRGGSKEASESGQGREVGHQSGGGPRAEMENQFSLG